MPRKRNTQRRMEIVNTAFRLFAEQGYDAVQMKDIADACDISKSLLQHYFPKKIVLLSTMLNELMLSAFLYSNEQLTSLSAEQRTMIQMSFLLRLLDENPKIEHFIRDVFESQELTTEIMLVTLDWLEAIGVDGETSAIRYAVNFALSGGMSVFFKRKVLKASVETIAEHIGQGFYMLLGEDQQKINRIYLSTAKYCTDRYYEQFVNYLYKHATIDFDSEIKI
ncbi:TetR family transcriptional regulator [Lactiplantibacillus fabifermentans T30PCM01]|uniref:TetR family transcriptional regulator n=1 Tax=Lactiplantibacillus fabifermentans T30PCM01 TaxID=1400520 RepID=W6T5H8_9LACO|nr:TetR/AcrR family transcriptional regulator [Lactiplantibacillus fabifermentans]ETY73053.1 TetR family transcriptional regulator [Lactiplantibacillus fabifermentans T30PCM01]